MTMTAERRAGANGARRGRLSLGPVLFHWTPERLRDFYFRVADEADVDIVYVGEAICAKRAPFFAPFAAEAVERLTRAGKEVVLSTLALAGSARERALVRDTVAGADDMMVEANDLTAVAAVAGLPHVVGPFVNVYNEGTRDWLVAGGARRICLPAELSRRAIAALADDDSVEIEVQVFGRLPLAVSSRCYHARANGLTKDSCRYVCAETPDGMTVETVDGKPFLAINGVSVLSFTWAELAAAIGPLRAAGIGVFRLWPHSVDMAAVASVYRDVVDDRLDAEAAAARLAALMPEARFADGFYYAREGAARGAAPAS